MNFGDIGSLVAAVTPRVCLMVLGCAVLTWMIFTGDYRIIAVFMADGTREVGEWSGLYEALTRVVTP